MDCSTPGLSVLHNLPKFDQVHVHCIGDAIPPSHPWMPFSPSALILSQHQGLFQWVSCSHQMSKILEFQSQHHPLQCSCLENPRDRGAWWAAVYGVAQSQIRLKRLSSSSSSISTNPCTSLKGEIVKQRFILCNYSLIAILIACTLSSCKVNGQILYLVVKNLPVKAGDSGDAGLIPRWGTIPRRRKWQPIPIPKYSCLGNPMDREAWQAIVHGVAKSWTQLSSWAHILVSTSHKPFWPCSSYYRMMVAYFFINIQVITRWNVNDFRIPKVVVWGKKLIFKPWTNQTQVKTIILNL